jgi:drug/metabolite transporter (DMT)-like permease
VFGATSVDLIGVFWGLGAAAGLVLYFVVGAGSADRVPPLVMAWGSLVVGAVALWVFGAVGAVHIHMNASDVVIAHHRTSFLVPVLGLSLVAAAFAYVAGIGASALLGPKLSSFVSLTEVLFAALFAWCLLGETLSPVQLSGGMLVVAGVALVRLDEFRGPTASVPPRRTQQPASAAPFLALTADPTRGS